MPITDYYGRKYGTTYLELSVLPEGGKERIVHHQLQDQDAYDTWHLSYYLKEIISYKKLLDNECINLEQLPRKEKNLFLYLIVACCPQFRTILELGSSLFEMIDGLQLVKKYLREAHSLIPIIDLKGISYLGIEISELLSSASIIIHPESNVILYSSTTEVEENFDILYDRAVSSYVFETAKEVAEFINCSEVALINFFLSKGETFVSPRLGKLFTYFSLEEVIGYLDKPLYHLFGEKAPGHKVSKGQSVVEGFFLCCSPEIANSFSALSQQDASIRSYFNEKQIVLNDASILLARKNR